MKNYTYLFILLFSLQVSAQDANTSMPELGAITVNPALTGLSEGAKNRVQTTHRNQWGNLFRPKGNFSVMRIAYDYSSCANSNQYWGIGGHITGTNAGVLTHTMIAGNVTAAYGRRLATPKLGDIYVSAGGQVGFQQYRLNMQNRTFNEQFDANTGYIDSNIATGEAFANDIFRRFVPNFGAGLIFFTDHENLKKNAYSIGISWDHLSNPRLNYFPTDEQHTTYLSVKWTIHSTATLSFGKGNARQKYALQPRIIVYYQKPFTQIQAGSSFVFRFNKHQNEPQFLRTGVAFRLVGQEGQLLSYSDALIFSTQLDIRGYSIGFAYDMNVSPLHAATNTYGSFELSLGKRLGNKDRCAPVCRF